jgi:DNA topoisomerase-2
MDEDGGDDGDEAAEIASVTNKELDTKLSDYDYLVGMAMIKLSEEEKDKMLKESDAKKLEYDLLLSKTWADLWKTDLDNFLVELDKQEEKERRDRESSLKQQIAKKTTELAGGRGKKKLIATLDEVRPSPKGARVQPKIEAMIKKYDKIDQAKAKEKTGGGRVRKPKKEAKNNSDEHDDADTPLHERVMKRRSDEADGNKNQPKLTKFLTKVEVGGGATKSKKKTDSVAAAAPKAKKPKRAAQFDSDEDEEEAASDSEKATSVGDWKKSITSDDGDSNLATPIESKKPSLRQKPKKTYVFDSDDDDNDNGKVDDDSEIVLSDDDDVSDDDF